MVYTEQTAYDTLKEYFQSGEAVKAYDDRCVYRVRTFDDGEDISDGSEPRCAIGVLMKGYIPEDSGVWHSEENVGEIIAKFSEVEDLFSECDGTFLVRAQLSHDQTPSDVSNFGEAAMASLIVVAQDYGLET